MHVGWVEGYVHSARGNHIHYSGTHQNKTQPQKKQNTLFLTKLADYSNYGNNRKPMYEVSLSMPSCRTSTFLHDFCVHLLECSY